MESYPGFRKGEVSIHRNRLASPEPRKCSESPLTLGNQNPKGMGRRQRPHCQSWGGVLACLSGSSQSSSVCFLVLSGRHGRQCLWSRERSAASQTCHLGRVLSLTSWSSPSGSSSSSSRHEQHLSSLSQQTDPPLTPSQGRQCPLLWWPLDCQDERPRPSVLAHSVPFRGSPIISQVPRKKWHIS